MARIEAAHEEEERQNDEKLDEVAAEDDSRILAERTDDDAGLDLCRELRGKGEDSDGQNVEQRTDQREKKLLCAMERLQQHGTIFRLGHEGERQPDSCRNQHNREYVAREERLQQIVRNDRKDVVIVGKRPKLLRHIGCTRTDDLCGQVARRDPHIERKSDRRR